METSAKSSTKAWVEEVEDMIDLVWKSFIWDNFDSGKIINIEFNLEYIVLSNQSKSAYVEI